MTSTKHFRRSELSFSGQSPEIVLGTSNLNKQVRISLCMPAVSVRMDPALVFGTCLRKRTVRIQVVKKTLRPCRAVKRGDESPNSLKKKSHKHQLLPPRGALRTAKDHNFSAT